MTSMLDAEQTLMFIAADWRARWGPHRGRHRYRLLPNAEHPVTGRPTYVGCEKCGKPAEDAA